MKPIKISSRVLTLSLAMLSLFLSTHASADCTDTGDLGAFLNCLASPAPAPAPAPAPPTPDDIPICNGGGLLLGGCDFSNLNPPPPATEPPVPPAPSALDLARAQLETLKANAAAAEATHSQAYHDITHGLDTSGLTGSGETSQNYASAYHHMITSQELVDAQNSIITALESSDPASLTNLENHLATLNREFTYFSTAKPDDWTGNAGVYTDQDLNLLTQSLNGINSTLGSLRSTPPSPPATDPATAHGTPVAPSTDAYGGTTVTSNYVDSCPSGNHNDDDGCL